MKTTLSEARLVITSILRDAKPNVCSATVKGHCMSPDLEDKSKIKIHRKRIYFPGDIVAVSMGPSMAVHRFIGYGYKKSIVAFTRADQNKQADPSMHYSNILGKANLPVTLKKRLECVMDWAQRSCKGTYRRVVG